MNIITTTGGIIMPQHPEQGIRDLRKAGFENASLEIGLFCQLESLWPEKGHKAPEDALRNPEIIRKGYQALLDVCAETGMKLPVGSLMGLSEKRVDLLDRYRQLLVQGIHACEEVGCRQILVPILVTGVERGQEWEANRDFLLDLAEACEHPETQLLLGNGCRDVNGHTVRGNCAEAEEAITWLEELNLMCSQRATQSENNTDRFGFCLNVGVCNICGQDIHELLRSLKGYVKAVMVSDNNGLSGGAFLPFTAECGGGSVDWLGLIRGLREIDYDGNLIFSYGSTVAAFSPLLRPGVLALAKSVADYFVWQIDLESALKRYDSIVLFGAGNMCRNYMKNYGQKYPPLFTCDNSSSRWGETFCTLEVRSPEALRNLPENCGVFICNIYYREIEKQLRDMGVKNIEYFNDEYMPSFDMDRLEMR